MIVWDINGILMTLLWLKKIELLHIKYNTIQYNTIFLFQLGSLKGQ
jgi:hypothetical protein